MNTLAIVLATARLFVPQGSEEQINYNPLERGETAYVRASDKEASVYIGKEGSDALSVIDRSALRGYKTTSVDRNDFVVIGSSPLVRDVEHDSWSCSGFKSNDVATLTFYVPGRYSFSDVSVKAKAFPDTGGLQHETVVSYVRNGNVVTANVMLKNKNSRFTYTMTVEKPTVRCLEYGDASHVTDLTDHHIPVKDAIGSLELGKWREWARDLYNGNRGENWSSYRAYDSVYLENNNIVYDVKGHYSQRVNSETNLVTYAGGLPAIEICHHGTSVTGALSITSCAVTNGTFYLTYFQDIAGFNPQLLDVYETYDPSGTAVWTAVPASQITRTGDDKIKIAAQSGIKQRYLKLRYNDDTESSVVEILLHGIVSVDNLNVGGTNVMALINGKIDAQAATNAAAAYFAANADYALTNLTVGASPVHLASGEIGNANMTADLAVTLDFSQAANRSGDCLLYLINATANDHDIVPTQTNDYTFVSTDLAKALTIGKATTNIVMFSRLKSDTIMVSKQEVK